MNAPSWPAELPPEEELIAELSQVLWTLPGDSSPGYPLELRYADLNAFRADAVAVQEVITGAARRLRGLSTEDLLGVSPQQALTYCGFVKVFVKNELHKVAKLEEGRVRLIFALDLVDRLVEQYLHARCNLAEIAVWEAIPSKPGMGLDDSSLNRLNSQLHAYDHPTPSDASGWDWSVNEDLLRLDLKARLAKFSPPQWVERAWTNREHLLRRCSFVFRDGSVVEQVGGGYVKSGSVITASSNSRMRYLLSRLVALRLGSPGLAPPTTMGDDCVEELPSSGSPSVVDYVRLEEAYAQAGFVVEVDRSKLSFCSTDFSSWPPYPERAAKMVATLLGKRPVSHLQALQLRAALAYELRNHPCADCCLRLVDGSGWGAKHVGEEERDAPQEAE